MAVATITILLVLLQKFAGGVPLDTMASIEISPHIVGGIDAPDGDAPHMMALVFGARVSSLICGASIISKSHALTAAHCIDAALNWDGSLMSSLRGACGSNQWDNPKKYVQFKSFINHEDWNPFTIKNDIGILNLAEELTFSKTIAAIPMGFNSEEAGAGAECYVTGWGRQWAWGPIPSWLQLIHVKIIDGKVCQELALIAAGSLWAPPIHPKIEICTLHPKGEGHGMCNGDSGSALVLVKDGTVVGIVSWGWPCATGAPDVFVRVSAYADWIIKNLQSNETALT